MQNKKVIILPIFFLHNYIVKIEIENEFEELKTLKFKRMTSYNFGENEINFYS